MRHCPKCGQRLTPDDLRCPTCRAAFRASDLQASARPSSRPSQPQPASTSQNRSEQASGLPDSNSQTGLLNARWSKTLLGSGDSAWAGAGADNWGALRNPDVGARIEPTPMVTVLGVPVPARSSSRPGSTIHPQVTRSPSGSVEMGIVVAVNSPSLPVPSLHPPEPMSPEPVPSFEPRAKADPEVFDVVGYQMADESTTGTPAEDIPPPPVNKTRNSAGPSRQSRAPRASKQPEVDVESLFYCIDSQVLGMAVPSERMSPSSAPPPSQRPSVRKRGKNKEHRRWVLIAIGLLLAAGAGMAYSKMQPKQRQSNSHREGSMTLVQAEEE